MMPLTIDRRPTQWVFRFDGDLSMSTAAELKQALIEALSAGRELDLDLESVEQIDVAILQLLWAAAREAARKGVRLTSRLSAAAAGLSRDAGLERWLDEPGDTRSGDGRR